MSAVTEVEGLLVRLIGDSTSYTNMINEADRKMGGFVRSTVAKANKVANGVSSALKTAGVGAIKLGGSVAAAGGAMLAPMLAATKQFADAGDQLHKMALRTGVSVEALSELKFAAEQSGTSIADVSGAIQKMNRRLGRVAAGQGSSQQMEAIQKLGLDLNNLLAMNPEGRFMAIAGAMKEYGDDTAAAGLAQRVLGQSVDKLLPLIKEGEAGIAAMRKEARDLGLQMSTKDANAAAALGDAWNRMTQTAKALTQHVGAALAPAVTWIADKFADVTTVAVNFVKHNRKLIIAVAGVATGAVIAGSAIAGVGLAAVGAAVAIKLIAASATVAAGILGAVFSPVGLVVGAVTVAVGLLAAEVAVVAGAFLHTAHQTGLLSDAWTHVKKIAKDLFATIKKTVGGITAAFETGDWKQAAHILWAGLKVAFLQGADGILGAMDGLSDKLWETVKKFFVKWVDATTKGAKTVAKIILNPLGNKQQMVLNFIWDISDSDGGKQGIGGWVKDQRAKAEKELDGLVAHAESTRDMMNLVNGINQGGSDGEGNNGAPGIEIDPQLKLDLDAQQREIESKVGSLIRSVEKPIEKYNRERSEVLDLVKAGGFEGQERMAVRVLDKLHAEYKTSLDGSIDKTNRFAAAQKKAEAAVMSHNQALKETLRTTDTFNMSRVGIEGDIQRMRNERGMKSTTDVAFTPQRQFRAAPAPAQDRNRGNGENKQREEQKVQWLKRIANNTGRPQETGVPAENVS